MSAAERARAAVLTALSEIAPEIDPAALDPGAPLRDQVDLDSFDFLNVIIRINELLGVAIPESDYERLASIDSTVDYLVARGG
jgi:acyl carrier protein